MPGSSGGPGGGSRGPRNALGAVTFGVVVLGAVLAVFPATAPLGLLLCLLAIIPAVFALRRTRRGTATDSGRALASVVMAPAFVVVAFVVFGASVSTVQVERSAAQEAVRAAAPTVSPAASPSAPLAPAPSSAPTSEPAPSVAVVEAPPPVPQAVPAGPRSPAVPATKPPSAARQAAVPDVRPGRAPVATVRVAPAPALPPAPAAGPVPVSKSKQAAAAPAPAPACDDSTHYVNSSGHCIPRPEVADADGASAVCNDGEYSFSEHKRGTCSGHGGVEQYLKNLP